jgi:hypothetical protein
VTDGQPISQPDAEGSDGNATEDHDHKTVDPEASWDALATFKGRYSSGSKDGTSFD